MSPTSPSPAILERRLRIRRIRKRVIATAAAVFVAAWSVIFFQLVAGRDPGLAATTHSTTQPAAPSTSSTSSPSSSGSSSSGSSSSSSSSSTSPAPVTTSQS